MPGWFGSSMPHDERKRAELRSMGFTDDVMIDRALTRARGNVESAVEMLFEGAIPPNGTAGFDPATDGPVVSPHAFATVNLLPPDFVPDPIRPDSPAPPPARQPAPRPALRRLVQ